MNLVSQEYFWLRTATRRPATGLGEYARVEGVLKAAGSGWAGGTDAGRRVAPAGARAWLGERLIGLGERIQGAPALRRKPERAGADGRAL